MTLTLLTVAMVLAANPSRVLSARRPDRDPVVVLVALGATLGLATAAAVLSGPLLDVVSLTEPSATIAAGIALLVVGIKDIFAVPPGPEPALAGWKAGLVPLAFPVTFSPAFAFLAVAGSADHGIATTVAVAVLALLPAAALLFLAPAGRRRIATSTLGIVATGVAALVVLDGVYAI